VGNLGRSLAERLRKKILLISGNLRAPKLHEVFELPPSNGFLSVVESKLPLDKAVKPVGKNLDVLTSNVTTVNLVNLVESWAMKNLFEMLKAHYDLILIDSAPLSEGKDGLVLSEIVDAVTVVVNEGKTRRIVAQNALKPLKAGKANFLGVILNDRKYVIPRFIYNRV